MAIGENSCMSIKIVLEEDDRYVKIITSRLSKLTSLNGDNYGPN